MAMNVYNDTYRTADGAYAVNARVAYEPKTSLYEVNLYVNNTEHERAYFDDRKTALTYATSGLMDLWLNPVESPTSVVTPAFDLSGFTLANMDADAVEHGACLSHIPEQCGCGDCLTYLAGQ